MTNKIHNYRKIILIIFFQLFITESSFSNNIENFIIKGNERVSKETIVMFSDLKIGDKYNNQTLNAALKKLFYTDYFKDVKIFEKNNIINIIVVENPIIQTVIINGIDENKIMDVVTDITSKSEKYPFVESKTKEQVQLLKNILKSYGYYFIDLETSIKKNNNNTIDLTYNFNLGNIAKIKKINFIGDKIFTDSVLRNIIVSEEAKFWKFITRNKFLDSARIKTDVFRLSEFYKNRGYFDVKIKSTTAVINEENQFELIFNIKAGDKYFFNNIEFVNTDDVFFDNLSNFEKKFQKLVGKKYSKRKINNLITELNNEVLREDFIFINANFDEIIKDNNLIDIVIKFDELEKIFVDRINILGNFITDEKVIRNSLIIDEGDPFNDILFVKSIENIKSKGIFKSVNYESKSDQVSNKIIDITVEEKATGEIFAGAGTGTSGSNITAGIKENNYLGLGIKLDTNVTITDDTIKGKFSVLNPNYNNTDKSIKTEIESLSDDFITSSGYKTSRTGITVGTEFEQANDLYVNLEISNFYEDLETSSNANNIVKKQEGTYFENLLSYTLTYNVLDQNFQPTDGFVNSFSQILPIISDDKTVENKFSSSAYHSLADNFIISAQLYLNSVNSIDDNVRISKRAYVPTRRLRGFENGKIGPKDGTQYIGGNYAAALNLTSTVPNIVFENEDIDLNIFLDMANVWEVDYNNSLDSNKIRSATGVAINWFSPIGPLSFSYAIPLSEAKTDTTENFRFQIGTSF
tara:strand:- start:1967 stop:4216 length:2250 start_codon:yes stop_codon:yes gene_type:complete